MFRGHGEFYHDIRIYVRVVSTMGIPAFHRRLDAKGRGARGRRAGRRLDAREGRRVHRQRAPGRRAHRQRAPGRRAGRRLDARERRRVHHQRAPGRSRSPPARSGNARSRARSEKARWRRNVSRRFAWAPTLPARRLRVRMPKCPNAQTAERAFDLPGGRGSGLTRWARAPRPTWWGRVPRWGGCGRLRATGARRGGRESG